MPLIEGAIGDPDPVHLQLGMGLPKPVFVERVGTMSLSNELLLPFNPFMEDTNPDPRGRRDRLLAELFNEYRKHMHQIHSLGKRIRKHEKKPTPTQRIEELGRYIDLVASVRRTRHELQNMSNIKKRKVHKRRIKLPLPRNIRSIMEEDSQNNLCEAVQQMQLNLESSVRKSECMLHGDNFLAKVESPSEISEDLSKLCMKD